MTRIKGIKKDRSERSEGISLGVFPHWQGFLALRARRWWCVRRYPHALVPPVIPKRAADRANLSRPRRVINGAARRTQSAKLPPPRCGAGFLTGTLPPLSLGAFSSCGEERASASSSFWAHFLRAFCKREASAPGAFFLLLFLHAATVAAAALLCSQRARGYRAFLSMRVDRECSVVAGRWRLSINSSTLCRFFICSWFFFCVMYLYQLWTYSQFVW